MIRLIDWFARNGVAANLLMLLIIGAGVLSVFRITQEIFPEFSLDMIQVQVEYLGASPDEVEEGVCVRVEEQVQGLDNIKRITSTAAEGMGVITIEVERGAEPSKVLDDVKARVDAIDTFPAETEKPIVVELLNRNQVIDVTIAGDTDEATLKSLGERVRDEIHALDGITLAQVVSARPYEVSIEVSEDALRRYGLTFDAVANAVRRSSLDLPGGSIRTRGGEILLRTKGQAYRRPDFEAIVLLTRADGTRLLLGDVAQIVDGFRETDQSARFNGKPAVIVQVYRIGDQSALGVSRAVKEYIREAQLRMPEGIELMAWRDASLVLKSRLNLLVRNGLAGFALVFLVLALFLRFRLAIWVSIGIPLSFLGALALMPALDASINVISLFAFIIVLGIVVDDAIVVGENIYTHQQRKKDGLTAAIDGAREVAMPVFFAILTTVAAFAPLISVAGNIGKVMRVIPLIVIPCLLFSLVESLLILPNHLSHTSARRADARSRGWIAGWVRFQSAFADRLQVFVRRVYRPSVDFALRWRYLTVAWGITTLLLTVGLIASGTVRFTFFPSIEADYVAAVLTMPQGTPAEVTAEAVGRLEATARQLQEELNGASDDDVKTIAHMYAAVGEQPFRTAQANMGPGASGASFTGAHLGEVSLELAPAEARDITSMEIGDRWRTLTGPIPDALELTFTSSLFSAGDAIDVQLTGLDIGYLEAAAGVLKRKLAEYPGVYDISDSFRAGKQEVRLEILPSAEALGLTLSDLARQVRQAFYGEEAQRIQRGRDDIRVMVRFPADERRSLGNLENMRIRTPAGAEVPFAEVAVAHLDRGYATIQRTDRQRSVNVTADVDPKKADANDILADLTRTILPAIVADYSGVSYSFEGQAQEQRETMGGLMMGFALALLVIYSLMAIPFRSYLQPLLVMSAIPFGLVGAVWGHVIMGMNLTIMSMFGIVALTGVVVNDSLVLVDFVNRKRASGLTLIEAVGEAGVSRFRPILLTSLTTFMGLTPLLLEKSMQARFLIPMATSLAFGIVFSTFVTLMIVPSGYMILEDLAAAGRRLRRQQPSPVLSSARESL